jgi:hypothetical protein
MICWSMCWEDGNSVGDIKPRHSGTTCEILPSCGICKREREVETQQGKVLVQIGSMFRICPCTMYYMYKSAICSSSDQCSLSQRIINRAQAMQSRQLAAYSSSMARGYVGNAAVTKECEDQSRRSRDQSLEGS